MTVMQDPVEIEQDLDRTRQKIGQTLDRIGERVKPSALQDVAVSGLVQARRYLETEADRALARAADKIPQTGHSLSRLVQRHPIKVAAVGILLGFLVSRSASRSQLAPQEHILIDIKEKTRDCK